MKKNITLPLPIAMAQFIFMLLITAFVVVPRIVSAQSVTDLLVHFDQSGDDSWINTGNVGIGTVIPDSKLTVQGETGGGILRLYSGQENDHVWIGLYNDGGPGSPRSAWIGYGNDGFKDLTLSNNVSGGDVILKPGTDGTVCLGKCSIN